ncbi:TPA: hypothetical protein ACSCWH_004350, partial [Aeromonas veronii]
ESNLLGKSSNTLLQTSPKEEIAITRLNIKNFVIYQLSNSLPPEGSGVGCGYYDEAGANDKCAIAKLMNNYVFEFCFNPDIDQDNIRHFLDHCLSHLSSSFQDEDEFYANKVQLPGGLDKIQMVHYWEQHKIQIREYVQQIGERFVYTSNYTASYIQDLSGVFTELDELANNSMPPNSMNTNNQPEGTTSEA